MYHYTFANLLKMLQTLLLNPNKEGRYQICLKDYIRSIHLIIVSKWCKFLVAQANWVACYILELFLHHYVVLTCFIVLKQPFWVHATIYEAPFVHWVITHLCACDDTRFSTTMLASSYACDSSNVFCNSGSRIGRIYLYTSWHLAFLKWGEIKSWCIECRASWILLFCMQD